MKMSDLHIEQMERDESPSTIRIENDVPLPIGAGTNGRPPSEAMLHLTEAIDRMNVGDSLILPKELTLWSSTKNSHQAKANVRKAFSKRNMKCTTRAIAFGRVRVWRIH
jgi:hypothetical protein